MSLLATQPFTADSLRSITLYGRTFNAVDDVVKIPTKRGAAIVSLTKSRRREDWCYDIEFLGSHFVMVDEGHLHQSLHKLIGEADLYA